MATFWDPGNIQQRARAAGVLYLTTTACALFAAMAVRGTLVVSADAAATAGNLIGHEVLYRIGFAADLLADLAYIAVVYLLYDVFKGVNQRLCALGAFFGLTGCAVGAVAALGHLAALMVLQNAALNHAFTTGQVHALALFALKLHGQGYEVSLVLFSVYCAIVGSLILRSQLIPRAVGVLMVLAGMAYVVDAVATFLFPAFSNPIVDNVTFVALIGEGALTLWLILFGIDDKRRRARFRSLRKKMTRRRIAAAPRAL